MNNTISKNGKINISGIDITISDIIGERLVNQWIEQLTEAQMSEIFKTLDEEIFEHGYDNIEYFKKRNKRDSSMPSWSASYEDTPIWKIMQQCVADKLGKLIEDKCNEIIESKEYQKRADSIAAELVEYATNGYKEDMKNRIRERLVGNVLDGSPTYGGRSLHTLINEEINYRMSE